MKLLLASYKNEQLETSSSDFSLKSQGAGIASEGMQRAVRIAMPFLIQQWENSRVTTF